MQTFFIKETKCWILSCKPSQISKVEEKETDRGRTGCSNIYYRCEVQARAGPWLCPHWDYQWTGMAYLWAILQCLPGAVAALLPSILSWQTSCPALLPHCSYLLSVCRKKSNQNFCLLGSVFYWSATRFVVGNSYFSRERDGRFRPGRQMTAWLQFSCQSPNRCARDNKS